MDSVNRFVSGGTLLQYFYAILVSVGSMEIGTVLAWSIPSLKHLERATSPVHLYTKRESYWIVASVPVGAIFGAAPSAFIANQIGIKTTLEIFSIPGILTWLIITFSPVRVLLHLARFISGVVIGALSGLIPLYINEISEVSRRGTLGSFFQVFMSLGFLLTYILGAFNSYYILSLGCTLVSILFSIFTIFIPASPYSLIQKELLEEAATGLKRIRSNGHDVQKEITRIQRDLQSTHGSFHISLVDIKALLLACTVMALHQFSGITAITYYTKYIIELSNDPSPVLCFLSLGCVQCISTTIFSFLIERIGRRMLLLLPSIVVVVILLTLGYIYDAMEKGKDVLDYLWVPLVCLIFFINFYSFGLGPLPWILCSELIQPNFRKIGIGIATAVNWLMAAGITFTFRSSKENEGTSFAFWTFAFLTSIGLIITYVFIPETKGKTPLQIRHALERHFTSL